ncbi:hypothetical protein ACFLXC_01930 [Chloroflexota bacterium]
MGSEEKQGPNYVPILPGRYTILRKKIWDSRADGIFASCFNFYATLIVQVLELEFKVPVITSPTSTLWQILKILKIKEPILGYGGLLSD